MNNETSDHSVTIDFNSVPIAPTGDPIIWKFMDFTKFIAMLEHGGFFFVKASMLEDEFEGSWPQISIEKYQNIFLNCLLERGSDENEVESVIEAQSEIHRLNRYWTTLSCWHMNNHESALWKLYTNAHGSIAICSKYSSLKAVLPESNYRIGPVRYIDFETDSLVGTDTSVFSEYFHKRSAFSHEQELRLVSCHPPMPFTKENIALSVDSSDNGIWVRVDLSQLIQGIRTSPNSELWVVDLIRRVLTRFGLETPVERSDMDATPMY